MIESDNSKKGNSKKLNFGRKPLLIGITICSLPLLFLLIYIFLFPKLSLEGSSYIKVSYGNHYLEEGYKASYLGTDITDKVWIEGKVDENKIGTYKLMYKVRKNNIVITRVRNVSVVDDTFPEITLKGDTEINLCPGYQYEEEGYTAIDNYDGELTNNVIVENLDNSILYEVSDSSSNKTIVKRILSTVDSEPPTITLKGGTVYYVLLGSVYNEPGYTAIDKCEGDLTSKVSITGSVDVNTPGEYVITYEVKDSQGNTSSVTRKVTVIEKFSTNSAIKGAIYLTFDDGPSATITPKLLELLKEKDVKATFFIINHSSNLDYLIKQEYENGHTVALHSMTHNYPTIYSSVDAYFSDLQQISDKVKTITGEEVKIIRFPGGSSNLVSRHYSKGIMTDLTKEVLNRGYHYFDWNIDSDDAGSARTSTDVYNNVVNNLSKNRANIVLMHDFENNYKTLNALSDIIDYGKANGYEFLAIDMSTAMSRHSVKN